MPLPRGIRNHNPGNLVRGDTRWQGLRENQTDPKFFQFSGPIWGLRALMKVLLTYQRRHDLQTIEEMIRRFAPPVENPSRHYSRYVADRLGMAPQDAVNTDDPDILVTLARAIVSFENGYAQNDWYDPEIYTQAMTLALT